MSDSVDPLTTKLQLAVLSGEELNVHWGPSEDGDSSREIFTTLLNENKVTSFEYHPNGAIICVVTSNDVRLYDSNKGSILHVLPAAGVRYAYFSPRGTYLVTWTPYLEEGPKKKTAESEDEIRRDSDSERDIETSNRLNMKVWSVSTGKEIKSYSQRRLEGLTWPPLRWSEDEAIAVLQSHRGEFRFVQHDFREDVVPSREKRSDVSEVESRTQESSSLRLRLAGATTFEIAPGPAPYKIAVFVPEKRGVQSAPAQVCIFHFPKLDKHVYSKPFYKAQEAKLLWNATGTALLVETHTQVDSSGKSYYGESALYYLSADGSLDINVPLRKTGPINATAWSPRGNLFAVCYGQMPTQTTLYSHKCVPLLDLGLAHRNTLIFNRQGTVLAVGGFKGLQGQMDFWDLSPVLTKLNTQNTNFTIRKFAVTESPYAHHVEWSPDGNFLLTAVLYPHLKIDNGFTIFRLDGTVLYAKKLERCWRVTWRPAAPELFSNPKLPISPLQATANNNTAPSATTPHTVKKSTVGEKYRHPHYRGPPANSHTEGHTRLQQDDGPRSYVNRIPGGTLKVAKHPPVGYNPVKTPTQTPKGQPKQPTQNISLQNPLREVDPNSDPSDIHEKSSNQQAPLPTDANKRKKKLVKKLKQIENLKLRRERGEQLQPEQIDKINQEEALKRELQSLTVSNKNSDNK